MVNETMTINDVSEVETLHATSLLSMTAKPLVLSKAKINNKLYYAKYNLSKYITIFVYNLKLF